ncbi:MAG: hypothetical protein AAF092_16695 [Pseudomonadota bacterium]
MAFIPASHHTYSDVVVSGVGAANTISSGPDNGANNNLACGFWNSMRNATTEQAVDNFLSRIQANLASSEDSDEELLRKGIGQLNIGGHGNEGFFTTGCGQDGQQDYKTNTMSTWNEFWWGTQLDRLRGKNFTILTFWSCHTGAGEEGADFLYAVAKRIGLPARGNTGWLYSNSKCRIWMEKGAQWQVAMPDRRPPAIQSPTPHFAPIEGKTVAFEGDEMISAENSKELILVARDTASREFRAEVEIPDEVQAQIISEIANSVELELPGNALGYFSHRLRIVSGDGRVVEFGIMNKRMLVNKEETRGILVPPSLRMFLQ